MPPETPSSPTIEKGICHMLFAYDVGLSVDLNECERRITSATERRTIRHKRRAPRYFAYEPSPLSITQYAQPIRLGAYQTNPNVELVVYEFGAVSVSYRISIEGPLDGLLALSDALYDNEALLADAQGSVEQLLSLIRPAVHRPNIAKAVEDYSIYEIQSLLPAMTTADILAQYPQQVAQILRSERHPLSDNEVADAFGCRISYGLNDVTLIDWNAAMILDESADDVRTVLEFANVELMEMRFLDEQLDKALDQSYEAMARRKRLLPTLGRGSSRDLRHVARLQMDSVVLFEGINNALKLIGDQYLARVYRLASQRFHLTEWDASILRKIEILESVYQKLTDRASSLRMELLEWIIIILIAAEIVMAFIPGLGKH
jgi:hypothetical protein